MLHECAIHKPLKTCRDSRTANLSIRYALNKRRSACNKRDCLFGVPHFAAHLCNVSQLQHPNAMQDSAKSCCEQPNILSQFCGFARGGGRRAKAGTPSRVSILRRFHQRDPSGGLIRQTTVVQRKRGYRRLYLGPGTTDLEPSAGSFFELDRDHTAFTFRIHNPQDDFVMPWCRCRRDLARNVLRSSHGLTPGFDNNIANYFFLLVSRTARRSRHLRDPGRQPGSLHR